MGTLFYAVNDEKRQFYELGKGGWHDLKVGDYASNLAQVKAVIRGGGWYESVVKNEKYHAKIAKELTDLGPARILNDGSTDIDDLGYECVGTRYKET